MSQRTSDERAGPSAAELRGVQLASRLQGGLTLDCVLFSLCLVVLLVLLLDQSSSGGTILHSHGR